MTENNAPESCNTRKQKQPISIPFVWEETPGIPKKDWKPTDKSLNTVKFVPPVKLIASIPFEWEEKPGTPLPSFPLPLPSALSPAREVHGNGDDYWAGADREIEPSCYESDDTFSSACSLLANGLISTEEISCAVPVEENIKKDIINLQDPPSPASETDSINSYATGTTSLVGTAFLEKLFPLLSPEMKSQENVSYLEKGNAQNPEIYGTSLESESNCSMIIRKPQLTLGDLIMMSRRRSYQRKANQMQNKSMSMRFIERSVLGCCMFGAGGSIEGLHTKWKRQLQLL